MPINAGLMSSATPEWATPQDLFDSLARGFGPFDLDVCATPENAKCPRFFTKADNGLLQTWEGKCWMNPPYGREIGLWVRNARFWGERGATVACLVPARTDTAWWQDNVERFDPKTLRMVRNPAVREILYLRGRVHFGGVGPAPFPSAVVVFGPEAKGGDQ